MVNFRTSPPRDRGPPLIGIGNFNPMLGGLLSLTKVPEEGASQPRRERQRLAIAQCSANGREVRGLGTTDLTT